MVKTAGFPESLALPGIHSNTIFMLFIGGFYFLLDNFQLLGRHWPTFGCVSDPPGVVGDGGHRSLLRRVQTP